VVCRIITDAVPEFVTMVTINNNRQNPVDPWNLHANDMIQLEIQDKFRDDLGIYYGRQERAFENLSDEDLEEQGITEHRAIELTRLARTFLVSDGDIDKLTRFREVFEDDRIYGQVRLWTTSATTRPPFHHDSAPHTRQGSGRTAFLRRGVGSDTHTGSLSSVTPFGRLCWDGPGGEVERLFLHQEASALLYGNVRADPLSSDDNDPEQNAAKEREPEHVRRSPRRLQY
jgi:hypothetical protein